MRGGNCNTYAYIDTNGDTDRYAGAVQLVSRAEHAYGFG